MESLKKMVETQVDLEDSALKRCLTLWGESLKYGYNAAFKAYACFTGVTASALVDCHSADQSYCGISRVLMFSVSFLSSGMRTAAAAIMMIPG